MFYGRHLQGEFTLTKWWNYEKKWLIIKSKDVYADKDWELETVLKPKK